jgi:hypothetical protein
MEWHTVPHEYVENYMSMKTFLIQHINKLNTSSLNASTEYQTKLKLNTISSSYKRYSLNIKAKTC